MADRKNKKPTLRLSDLRQGLPTLTPAKGAELAEAATVCLDHHGHKTWVEMTVQEGMTGASTVSYDLVRLRATVRMRRTHADLQDATEDGACAIAVLLVKNLSGMIIERSQKGTGIDYWLCQPSASDDLPFEHSARLEVSGDLQGSDAECRARLQTKRRQSERSDGTGLPAWSVVVEFSSPKVFYDVRNVP